MCSEDGAHSIGDLPQGGPRLDRAHDHLPLQVVDGAVQVGRGGQHVGRRVVSARHRCRDLDRDLDLVATNGWRSGESLGWPTDPTRPKERDPSAKDTFSDFTMSGKEPMSDLVEAIYREFNERNNTNVPAPK